MADIQRGKGSILVSYLCPEGMNATEQIDLQHEMTQLIKNILSEKHLNMRYVIADDELIKKEVKEAFEKKL